MPSRLSGAIAQTARLAGSSSRLSVRSASPVSLYSPNAWQMHTSGQSGLSFQSIAPHNQHLAPRSFSTTRTIRSQSDSVIEDPDHPSGIYFHKMRDGRYAMSLFAQAPSSPTAASVMALIAQPTSGDLARMPIYQVAVKKPDLLQVNEDFIKLLHETLKEEGVPQDGLIEYEAALRKTGWAHVADQRHPLMPGRIPTPENIIASVAFVDSQVDTESYTANDTYRLVTAEEGIMQLRPSWLDLVKKRCQSNL